MMFKRVKTIKLFVLWEGVKMILNQLQSVPQENKNMCKTSLSWNQ